MRIVVLVLSALFCSGVDAQTSPLCAAKAVGKDGRPLTGQERTLSIKKCQAEIKMACEVKAFNSNGQRLSGSEKSAFIRQCQENAG